MLADRIAERIALYRFWAAQAVTRYTLAVGEGEPDAGKHLDHANRMARREQRLRRLLARVESARGVAC